MKILLICVCVPCSLSELASIIVRTSDNEAVKENGRKLQVPEVFVVRKGDSGYSKLTSLINSENEASLFVNPKCL